MITYSMPPNKLSRMVSAAWHGRGVAELKRWAEAHPEEAVHVGARDRRLRVLLERWAKEGRQRSEEATCAEGTAI